MIDLTKLPKRPYKNFDDFYKKNILGCNKDVEWPCFLCDGYKKIHHWEDRDPYEGYKMAPLYTCHQCNGTGQTTKQQWKDQYKSEIDQWKQRYALAKQKRDLQSQLITLAKQHFTKQQLQLIGLEI